MKFNFPRENIEEIIYWPQKLVHGSKNWSLRGLMHWALQWITMNDFPFHYKNLKASIRNMHAEILLKSVWPLMTCRYRRELLMIHELCLTPLMWAEIWKWAAVSLDSWLLITSAVTDWLTLRWSVDTYQETQLSLAAWWLSGLATWLGCTPFKVK